MVEFADKYFLIQPDHRYRVCRVVETIVQIECLSQYLRVDIDIEVLQQGECQLLV